MKIAGIFDQPKSSLDPKIFTSEFKLKPEVRLAIVKRLRTVTSIKSVRFTGILLMGSLTTFQYNDGSDTDVQTQLAPEYDKDFDYWHEIYRHTNGWLLPNTKHPVNFFPVLSTSLFRPENLSGGYDLITDTWIKFPSVPTYADVHRFDLDKPVFDLQINGLLTQLQQMKRRPKDVSEAVDVAEIFHELDVARKQGFDYPGMQGGAKSFGNALYKWMEKKFGEKPEHVYQKLKKKLFMPPKIQSINE